MKFFKLPNPSKSCAECAKSFAKGHPFYSSLVELDELNRKDFCHECFPKISKPTIWWQTPKDEKEVKPILLTAYEKQLYEMLMSAVNEQNKSREWVYFLAHYFKRRKVFLSQGECQQDGLTYEIFASKETQEVYLIPKSYPKSDILQSILEEIKNVSNP